MKLIFLGYNQIIEKLALSFSELDEFSIHIYSNKHIKVFEHTSVSYKTLNSDEELSEQIERLDIEKSDLLISVGCPWILKDSFLRKVDYRLLNLHGAHLPLYRGGTIHSWYILNRRRTGLCCLHKMTTAIDAGAICRYEEYFIPTACRIPADLIKLSDEENVRFLEHVISDWKTKKVHPADVDVVEQPEYLSSYWPRLKAVDHAWVNWSWTGQDIESFVCAFDEPYAGARTRWKGHVILLKEVYFQPGNSGFHPFQDGLVYRKCKEWLSVAVSDGELLIKNVTDVDGKSIFEQVIVGDRFYSTPDDILNQASKVKKTSSGLKSIKYW